MRKKKIAKKLLVLFQNIINDVATEVSMSIVSDRFRKRVKCYRKMIENMRNDLK